MKTYSRNRIFIGRVKDSVTTEKPGGVWKQFLAKTTPTVESHPDFESFKGPFRNLGAARYMMTYPHTDTVYQAEKLSKRFMGAPVLLLLLFLPSFCQAAMLAEFERRVVIYNGSGSVDWDIRTDNGQSNWRIHTTVRSLGETFHATPVFMEDLPDMEYMTVRLLCDCGPYSDEPLPDITPEQILSGQGSIWMEQEKSYVIPLGEKFEGYNITDVTGTITRWNVNPIGEFWIKMEVYGDVLDPLQLWRGQFGKAGTGLISDWNHDSTADAADYVLIRKGSGIGLGAIAVPEQNTRQIIGVLCIVGIGYLVYSHVWLRRK